MRQVLGRFAITKETVTMGDMRRNWGWWSEALTARRRGTEKSQLTRVGLLTKVLRRCAASCDVRCPREVPQVVEVHRRTTSSMHVVGASAGYANETRVKGMPLKWLHQFDFRLNVVNVRIVSSKHNSLSNYRSKRKKLDRDSHSFCRDLTSVGNKFSSRCGCKQSTCIRQLTNPKHFPSDGCQSWLSTNFCHSLFLVSSLTVTHERKKNKSTE